MMRKSLLLLALLAFVVPSASYGYEVGEVFTAEVGTDDGTVEMQFQRIEGSYYEVQWSYSIKQCRVYGESGNPAIPSDYYGSLVIPSQVEDMVVIEISDYAFEGCYNLTEVRTGSGISIDGYSFGVYPIRRVGEYAFKDCSSLSTFDWTRGPTERQVKSESLGAHAFEGCSNLQSVNLPLDLSGIGDYAFYQCGQLQSITFSLYDRYTTNGSIGGVGTSAFEECTMLTQFNLNGEYGGSVSDRAFYGCSSLESVTGLSSVSSNAFENCSALQSVSFSERMDVYDGAFAGCYNLKTINIDAEVSSISISENAFVNENEYSYDKISLLEINIDSSNPYFGKYSSNQAIIYNHALILGCENTVIPTDEDVYFIEKNAFTTGCPQELVIPKNIESLHENDFGYSTVIFEGSPYFNYGYNGDGECKFDGTVYFPAYAANANSGFQAFMSLSRGGNSQYMPYLKFDNEWNCIYFSKGWDDGGNFQVPDGLQAYIVTGYDADKGATTETVTTFNAGQAVLIEESAPGTMRVVQETTRNDYDSNMLVGSEYGETIYEYTSYTDERGLMVNFTLKDGEFERVSDDNPVTVPAFGGWLEVSASSFSTKEVLTITVVDDRPSDNGKVPVSGATVTITNQDNDSEQWTETTDEQGVLEIKLPAGTYTVRAEADRHESGEVTDVSVVLGKENSVEVELAYLYGTLKVTAYDDWQDENGNHAKISSSKTMVAVANQSTNKTFENEDKSVSFNAEVPEGLYTISVYAEDYKTRTYRDIVVKRNEPCELEALLTYLYGTMTVTVKSDQVAEDGSNPPIQGAKVTISGTENVSGTTDENGKYSTRIKTGSYSVNVEAKNYESQSLTEVEVKKHEETVKEVILKELLGTLTLDIIDEFSYYDNGPHVSGASIWIYKAGSDVLVASGTSGDDGLFITKLPAGAYDVHVEAALHESKDFKNLTLTLEGNKHTLPISYTGGITAEWLLEETEIENSYVVTNTFKFETTVPAPQVELQMPSFIDCENLAIDETKTVDVTLTNKGRINAIDVNLFMPASSWLTFEPQTENTGLTLATGESKTIPVKITRTGNPANDKDCKTWFYWAWGWYLGETTTSKLLNKLVTLGTCDQGKPLSESVSETIRNYGSGGAGDPNNSTNQPPSVKKYEDDHSPSTTSSPINEEITIQEPGQPEQKARVDVEATVDIEQEFVMARQAFRATIPFVNKTLETVSDYQFTLTIRDEDGKVATSEEFEIECESLTGFKGAKTVGSKWSLDSREEGTVTLLIIPTKNAAPTENKVWRFTLGVRYTDPKMGEKAYIILPIYNKIVTPCADLNLTYFLQRNVTGDDPLTENKVETGTPAEFALLINNVGYGDARNVRLTSQQPEITENKWGLDLQLTITESKLNGEDVALALDGTTAMDFGNIAAHSTAYAQWWISSNLLGHFDDYKASFTQVTGEGQPIEHGNQYLSIIGEVSLKELTKTIYDGLGNVRGFLSKGKRYGAKARVEADSEDADEDYSLYLTDGTVEEVHPATATLERTGDNLYTLTLTGSETGWGYATVENPHGADGEIVKAVLRSDRSDVLNKSVWGTDVTFFDDDSWIHEGVIHVMGKTDGTPLTYNLTIIDTSKPYYPGDVNEDGVIDINDVVACINHIGGNGYWRYANVNGDTDEDGNDIVDINDVVEIIQKMANRE